MWCHDMIGSVSVCGGNVVYISFIVSHTRPLSVHHSSPASHPHGIYDHTLYTLLLEYSKQLARDGITTHDNA